MQMVSDSICTNCTFGDEWNQSANVTALVIFEADLVTGKPRRHLLGDVHYYFYDVVLLLFVHIVSFLNIG